MFVWIIAIVCCLAAQSSFAVNIQYYAGGGVNDGGPAVNGFIHLPTDAVLDSQGNLYIADTGNHRIRKVAKNGIISTVAGTGIAGYSGEGGPGVKARLCYPTGVAADSAGNIYITDKDNHRIRKTNRQWNSLDCRRDRNGGIFGRRQSRHRSGIERAVWRGGR